MKPFTDASGRTWELTVVVSAVNRVRDLLGVDLMDVAGGDLLERLADDPVLLVDVLYVLVKPQADAKGASDEDFGRGMVGGVLDDAASALMKELLGFFPSAQRARALGKMARKIEAQQAAVAEAAAALAVMPLPGEAAPETGGGSSGNSPASLEPTPTG